MEEIRTKFHKKNKNNNKIKNENKTNKIKKSPVRKIPEIFRCPFSQPARMPETRYFYMESRM